MIKLPAWRTLLSTFIFWRLILFIITFLGLSALPHLNEQGLLSWPPPSVDYWLRWANWDGGHFRGIAENGYLPFQVVFFPLYPLLIKILMLIGLPSLWGGLIISHIFALISLFYLYKLVQLDFDQVTAQKSILLLLAFPTSFYLGTVYSESLFLALTLASFYYARTNRWLIASTLAGLSSVTRLVGVVVIMAIACEYLVKSYPNLKLNSLVRKKLFRIISYLILILIIISIGERVALTLKSWLIAGIFMYLSLYLKAMLLLSIVFICLKILVENIYFKRIVTLPSLWIILSLVPLGLYMFYLYQTQGNPLAFINHESIWNRHPSPFWEAPIAYFNFLLAQRFFAGYAGQTFLELLFLIIFLIIFTFSLFRLRLSYLLYFILLLIIPLSSGTLVAIHRYELMIFPAIIMLATVKHTLIYHLWLYLSLALLGILSVMFINGYWVT